MSHENPIDLGPYRLLEALGQGGMATVYRAVTHEDEALLAVKIISKDIADDEQFLRRFQREGRTMLQFDHPNILPVYDYGQIDGQTYIAMKLASGGNLRERIQAQTFDLETIVPVLEQIVQALDYAHSQGVIHRDLKPDNILLDDDGHLYLCDFGIAKLKEESAHLTVTGAIIGTPSYMAPELWRSEPVDARVDVYAFGILIYEMLSGVLPYEADTPFSLMYKHLDMSPPSLATLVDGVPRTVAQVLQRAMAKTPQARYSTANDLLDAFLHAQAPAYQTPRTPVAYPTDDDERSTVVGEVIQDDALQDADTLMQDYNAVDAGASVLHFRAEEASRELQGEEAILAQSVANYVQHLRETAKHDQRDSELPYRSLESYDLRDNRAFFGREQAIDAMLARVPQASLTVLHAESGTGKTSLIRAGLLPRLVAGGYLPLYVAVRWQAPHTSIKQTLLPNSQDAPQLAKMSLRGYLHILTKITGDNRDIFIFIDQFETFFTDTFDEETRQAFIRELAECLDDPLLPVHVTLSMRTEYFGRLASFQPTIAQPFSNEYLLRSLTAEEAHEALVRPAEQRGYQYDDDVVNTILADLADETNAIIPSQLQLVGGAVIEQLLEERKHITLDDYIHAGSAEGILQSFLARMLMHFDVQERRLARRVIEALVRADQSRDVRTFVSLRDELSHLNIGDDALGRLESVLKHLRENRVLRLVDTDGGEGYELVHDYLARQVQIDPETVARKAAQELLQRRTRDFEQYASILTNEELAVIEPQLEVLSITESMRALLDQSTQVRRQQMRRNRLMVIGGVVALVMIIGLGMFLVVRENINAQQRLVEAETSEARIAVQRDIAEANALTATIAQGEALDQASTAVAANDEALNQANIAATQADIAQNNALTATIAQGVALNQASTAVVAEDAAVVQANIAATQAVIAQDNALTATLAQGDAINQAATAVAANDEALAQANIAATNEAIAINNAATATIALGESNLRGTEIANQVSTSDANALLAENNASTAVAALDVAEESLLEARAQSYTANARQLLSTGDVYLALNLALAAHAINPDLPIAHQVMSEVRNIVPIISDDLVGVGYRIEIPYYTETSTTQLHNRDAFTFIEEPIETNEELFIETFNAVFSPDSQWAATALTTGAKVTLWGLASATSVNELTPDMGHIQSMAFSNDSQFVVIVAVEGVSVWDIESQEQVYAIPIQAQYQAQALAMSHDGTRFAVGGSSPAIIIYDLATGDVIHTLDQTQRKPQRLAFSADDTTLIVWHYVNDASRGIRTYLMEFWDTQSGTLERVSDNIWYRGFTDDEIYAWSGGARSYYPIGGQVRAPSRGAIQVHGTKNSNIVMTFENGFDWRIDSVRHLDFSPDGTRAIVGVERYANSIIDGYLDPWVGVPLHLTRLVDMNTGAMLMNYAGTDIDGLINDALFISDNRSVVSTTTDNRVILWDSETGRITRTIGIWPESDTSVLTNLGFSPDERFIMTHSADNHVQIWAINGNGRVALDRMTMDVTINDFALSADESQVYVASARNLHVIERDTGNQSALWTLSNTMYFADFHPHRPEAVVSIPYSGDEIGVAWVIDLTTGETIYRYELPEAETRAYYRHGVHYVEYTSNGDFLLAQSHVIDANTQALLSDVEIIPRDANVLTETLRGALSDDGTRFMTPLSGATTEIFAVGGQDTTRLCRLPWCDEIPRVAIFNPTGETIFVGLSQPSATIQQIDVASCEVMREFVGHQDNITDLALHPNGEILASVSLDGTALMWDIATGEMLSELSNNGQPINRIMFSEDGTHFFIADDNSISEWEFIDDASLLAWASGTAEVSPLTCEQRQQYAIPPLCESNE